MNNLKLQRMDVEIYILGQQSSDMHNKEKFYKYNYETKFVSLAFSRQLSEDE